MTPCATCSIPGCAAAPNRVVSIRSRKVLQIFLFLLGSALVFTALVFQGGTALKASAQGTPIPQTTPTLDRLAKPTLPARPSQADLGALVYWYRCMPCHGERGQGLTQEFRETYPPEDQNCWNRGCHGDRPYENGFTLPMVVPPIIGPGALQKFPSAARLEAFIAAAMPFSKPGDLSADDNWKVTAFLLRQNHLWAGASELGPGNAEQLTIAPPGTPAASAATPTPAVAAPLIVLAVLIGAVAVLILRRHRSS